MMVSHTDNDGSIFLPFISRHIHTLTRQKFCTILNYEPFFFYIYIQHVMSNYNNNIHRGTKFSEKINILYILKWKQGFEEYSKRKGKTEERDKQRI